MAALSSLVFLLADPEGRGLLSGFRIDPALGDNLAEITRSLGGP
jgi:hypothetical protein